MAKKVVLAAGTGYLGNVLAKYFIRKGWQVVILTRTVRPNTDTTEYVAWDSATVGAWQQALEGSEIVINLTGKSVNCRYNETNKKEIIRSRVESTHAIGEAIRQCKSPPKLWMNAGSAAIYGDTGNNEADDNYPPSTGFSPEVCKLWEAAFFGAETPHTRKVMLRIGIVLGKEADVLKPFLSLVRFGLGGTIGSGKQGWTWIHEDDFCDILYYIYENVAISGTINICSPNPVSNALWMKTLRKVWGTPIGLPAPGFMVRVGTALLGTEPGLVLGGRYVVPSRLIAEGYQWKYPELKQALLAIHLQ